MHVRLAKTNRGDIQHTNARARACCGTEPIELHQFYGREPCIFAISECVTSPVSSATFLCRSTQGDHHDVHARRLDVRRRDIPPEQRCVLPVRAGRWRAASPLRHAAHVAADRSHSPGQRLGAVSASIASTWPRAQVQGACLIPARNSEYATHWICICTYQ